jgi:hypothetical protein
VGIRRGPLGSSDWGSAHQTVHSSQTPVGEALVQQTVAKSTCFAGRSSFVMLRISAAQRKGLSKKNSYRLLVDSDWMLPSRMLSQKKFPQSHSAGTEKLKVV